MRAQHHCGAGTFSACHSTRASAASSPCRRRNGSCISQWLRSRLAVEWPRVRPGANQLRSEKQFCPMRKKLLSAAERNATPLDRAESGPEAARNGRRTSTFADAQAATNDDTFLSPAAGTMAGIHAATLARIPTPCIAAGPCMRRFLRLLSADQRAGSLTPLADASRWTAGRDRNQSG